MTNIKEKGKTLVDENSRDMGTLPDTDMKVIATVAKYGPVIKLCDKNGKKCKYAPIKEPLTIETITMDDVVKLFKYPIKLGKHNKKDVWLYKGQYGLYLKYNGKKYSMTPSKKPGESEGSESESEIATNKEPTLEDAIKIIQEKEKSTKAEFENDKYTYTILEGQYGPYIVIKEKKKLGKKYTVSIPADKKIDSLTLEQVQELVQEGLAKKRNRWKKKGTGQTAGKYKKKYKKV
jgi:DNA topoisomerase-1